DHFKCYRIANARLRRSGVAVTNQFETSTVDIRKPKRLCLPADKNGEGFTGPQTSLMCYSIRRRFVSPPGEVLVDNQFGPHPDTFDLKRMTELCVPVVTAAQATATPTTSPSPTPAAATATAATPTETA